MHNPSTMDDPVQSWLKKLGKTGEILNTSIAAVRDVVQTAGEKLYLPDLTAEYAAKEIIRYKKENKDINLASIHLHSQAGAIGTSISALYLPENIKAEMEYLTYGSASNPVFGWKSQRHRMNLLDPVSHISGRGLLFAPVALMDTLRPDVTQDWNIHDQKGSGNIVGIPSWYHSWYPSYENSPAR